MSKILGFANILKILWKSYSVAQRVVICVLIIVLLGDIFALGNKWYYRNATIVPKNGGIITEGVYGSPSMINPAFAQTSVDRTLSSLVFSGLVGYDSKKELIPVLAERWEVSPDQQDYKVFLKQNLEWHDGQPFNSEDIFYTVAVVQNPDYSGDLKSAWNGVQITKIDDYTVNFHLPQAYSAFLNTLTIGILPHHLWVDIPVKDFGKSGLNLRPVGLGPYKLEGLKQDEKGRTTTISLTKNIEFALGAPYIKNINFRFYETEEKLVKGFSAREFTSFGIYSSAHKNAGRKTRGYINNYVSLPQYVSLFFNLKRSTALTDLSVRQALAYATDKNEINKVVNSGAGIVLESPVLPDYLGYDPGVKKYEYSPTKATTILSQAGWIDQNSDGIKEKDNRVLSFGIVLPNDPALIHLADSLQKQWKEIGVQLTIQTASSGDMETKYLTGRDYDILLIGESVGSDPDLYSYWHSSQAFYPGLNLSLWENGEADRLLEEARQNNDSNVKISNYKKFQEIVAENIPAIFLYQPTYVYKIYQKVQGVDLSRISNTWERFMDSRNWFVNFERVKDI